MLVDANLLLYAVDEHSPFHDRAAGWLTDALNGPRRVGIPWMSLIAFLRISTNPRASLNPLSPSAATEFAQQWLAADIAWIPEPGPRHADIFFDLIETEHLTGNLISDGHLAAIAIEHGLVLMSNDSDFARFPALRWMNPLAA